MLTVKITKAKKKHFGNGSSFSIDREPCNVTLPIFLKSGLWKRKVISNDQSRSVRAHISTGMHSRSPGPTVTWMMRL